jgi:hypothetical protein
LVYDETLVERILDAVVGARAKTVYAPSWWEIHPDHHALALAAAEAVRRSPRGLWLSMYEVGVPLHPNRLLDISDLLSRKHAALGCFKSQLAIQRYDTQIAALNRYRTYTLPADVVAAEAYRLLSQEDLLANPLRAIRPGYYYALCGADLEPMPALVSVLILCRQPTAVEDALDSVALQTYSHLEVLVPADSRMPVPPSLNVGGQRVPIREIEVDSAVASSVAAAANVLMQHARGENLLLVTDGEVLSPSHIALLSRSLVAARHARWAVTGFREQDASDDDIGEGQGSSAGTMTDLWGLRSLNPTSCLFERSLFTEGCRFCEQLRWPSALWDFWLQLRKRANIAHVPYTQWPGSPAQRSGRVDISMCADPADVGDVIDKWSADYVGHDWASLLAAREEELRELRESRNKWRRRTKRFAELLRQRGRTIASLRKQLSAVSAQLSAQEAALEIVKEKAVCADANAPRAYARRSVLARRLEALDSSTSRRATLLFRLVAVRFRCILSLFPGRASKR